MRPRRCRTSPLLDLRHQQVRCHRCSLSLHVCPTHITCRTHWHVLANVCATRFTRQCWNTWDPHPGARKRATLGSCTISQSVVPVFRWVHVSGPTAWSHLARDCVACWLCLCMETRPWWPDHSMLAVITCLWPDVLCARAPRRKTKVKTDCTACGRAQYGLESRWLS